MKKLLITTLVFSTLTFVSAEGATSTQPTPMRPIGAGVMARITTGDATIDAQVKVLRDELETKMRALQTEYEVKIKALIGDRKPVGNGTTTPKEMKRGEDRSMERREEGQMMRAEAGASVEVRPLNRFFDRIKGMFGGAKIEANVNAQ